MTRFSIIMPVYNSEKHITSAITSILNQTFDNFEILIINDGSSDNTLDKLMYFENNNKIKIINYQDNRGVSFARNLGIKNANGEFLLFLDSDDYLEANCLTELNEILKNKNIDIISFGFVKSHGNFITDYSNKKYDKQYFTNDKFLEKYLKREIAQCMCSFVCRKNIIKANEILFSEDIFFAEDQEFQIRCMFHSNNIYYVSFPYFKYNIQDSSVMNGTFSVKRLTSLKAFINLFTLFSNSTYLKKLFTNYFYYNYYSLFKFMLKSNVDFILLANYKEKYKINKFNKPYLLLNRIGIVINILFYLENNFPKVFNSILKFSK